MWYNIPTDNKSVEIIFREKTKLNLNPYEIILVTTLRRHISELLVIVINKFIIEL